MKKPINRMTLRHAISLVFAILCAPVFAQNNADCVTAMEICEKKSYKITKTGGEGKDIREADFMHCFMNGENKGQAEENSTWIKFEIAESGSLSFTITPQRNVDDIDFVVYRLGDQGTCDTKKIVRCCAAGASEIDALNSPCMGKTGLSSGETDSSEDAGCSDVNDNAWLAPLKVAKGEKYLLLVSNVTASGPGFTIDFAGTAKMPCDKKKPLAENKPKKKDIKPKEKTTEPAMAKLAPPAEIGGRKVEVGDELKVKSNKLKIKLWDSQVEDGDIISVYIGDQKVLSNIYLRLKPVEYEIELPAGREHFITVYSESFGKAEPNTAMVSFNDGQREQTIDLVAGRSKQESVRIIRE